MSTTDQQTLVGGIPSDKGYRQVVPGQGAGRIVRTDLSGGRIPDETQEAQTLLVIAHLADLHVCDSQSPARAEMIDRYADPDSPLKEWVDQVGSYRSNEMLTAQVTAAMVDAVNGISAAPVTGAPVDLAIITGDNTDNGQLNELQWYLALLEGGQVRPDSGDLSRYEGVADDECYDEHYWHPETEKEDLPRSKYGFPSVPGFLAAARRAFTSDGLAANWLAVHGNHDRMVQGTIGPVADVHTVPIGTSKPIALPEHWSGEQILQLISDLDAGGEEGVRQLRNVIMREVTADPARRTTTRQEFVASHFGSAARPRGHGFTDGNQAQANAYYRWDQGSVSFLVLDTVNPNGYWQGSLDTEQARWLESELTSAQADRRYVVLASHHPLFCLTNARMATDNAEVRVLETEVQAMLGRYSCVIAWLNGHTHTNRVVAHTSSSGAGWWEITAPSLIDWPQQARVVELSRTSDGLLRLDCTGIDHTGQAPWNGDTDSVAGLAGLARELAANDWQGRRHEFDEQPRHGLPEDRNVTLVLPDPYA